MKLIKTIVRANRVEDVREALSELNLVDMTVTAVRGAGDGRAPQPAANALIELVVRDETVADVIQAITRTARTEDIGDGHVSVFPLEQEGFVLPSERDIV